MTKQKLFKYLLSATIILMVINIAIDTYKKPKKESPISELSVSKIETDFFSTLDEYGIELKWISKKKYHSNQDDSVKTEYEVKIPADMPVPLIIKDINKKIQHDITAFVSEEKKIYGKTEIRIYTNEVLKLKATLVPDKQIIRKRNSLSFIIDNAFDLSEKEFNNFLSVNYQIACEVIPDKKFIIKADSLKDYSKEYILMLSDDIGDSKMKLKPEYQKELLDGAVQNIISSFRDAKAYIIDKKSSIYNSKDFNFVMNDFKRNDINLNLKTDLISLIVDNDNELITKFNTTVEDTNGIKQKIFLMPFADFKKVENQIESFKKKGCKIIPVSKTYLAQKPSEQNKIKPPAHRKK